MLRVSGWGGGFWVLIGDLFSVLCSHRRAPCVVCVIFGVGQIIRKSANFKFSNFKFQEDEM